MAESDLQTYHGKCQCGTFQFSVELPLIKQVTVCNCSICVKKGYLWAFPSSDQLFVVEKGDGKLKDYHFGSKTMSHKFCPTCGTSVMGARLMEGPSIGVNVRALEGIDIDQLEIGSYDGGKLEPVYQPTTDPKTLEADIAKGKYHGSCHCGKVTLELNSKPLKELEASEDNCSICTRNAYLWLYPSTKAVSIKGKEHLTSYYFGTKLAGHSFCSTCGVPVLNQLDDPEGKIGLQPINMRVLNGVNFDELKIKKTQGKYINFDSYNIETPEGLERARGDAMKFWEGLSKSQIG